MTSTGTSELPLKQILHQLEAIKFPTTSSQFSTDFSEPPNAVVTELLAASFRWRRTGETLTTEDAWKLGISQRRSLLIRLCAESDQDSVWSAAAACSRCNERIDYEIPLSEVIAYQVAAEEKMTELMFSSSEGDLRFRRPTGLDQRYWTEEGYDDLDRASSAIMLTLQVDGSPASDLCREEVALLEAEFEAFDPLAAFSISAACPYCASENTLSADMERLSLERLQRMGKRMLDEVHLLARHYHWPEKQIVNLTAFRRQEYIKRILNEYRNT